MGHWNAARKTMESRPERKARLMKAGVWKEFVQRRDDLVREGASQKQASQQADEEFRHYGVENEDA